MEKNIYIVTSGEYSDYSIRACFSTREKAKEYINIIIERLEEGEDLENWYRIEEYPLDTGGQTINFIKMQLELKVDFDGLKEKNSQVTVQTELRSDAREETYLINSRQNDNKILILYRIANPNKKIEEEIKRVKKVAYDTLKRMNYLLKVENVKLENLKYYLERR